ncbi:MAG: hypothetical protein Kow0040_14870 [Thermogutta sp.]
MSKRRQGTEEAADAPPDQNERKRRIAHDRLDELFEEATAGRFYGRVAIEITFEDGRADTIYRKIDGRDK